LAFVKYTQQMAWPAGRKDIFSWKSVFLKIKLIILARKAKIVF
jgi:hypothetical protein